MPYMCEWRRRYLSSTKQRLPGRSNLGGAASGEYAGKCLEEIGTAYQLRPASVTPYICVCMYVCIYVYVYFYRVNFAVLYRLTFLRLTFPK